MDRARQLQIVSFFPSEFLESRERNFSSRCEKGGDKGQLYSANDVTRASGGKKMFSTETIDHSTACVILSQNLPFIMSEVIGKEEHMDLKSSANRISPFVR